MILALIVILVLWVVLMVLLSLMRLRKICFQCTLIWISSIRPRLHLLFNWGSHQLQHQLRWHLHPLKCLQRLMPAVGLVKGQGLDTNTVSQWMAQPLSSQKCSCQLQKMSLQLKLRNQCLLLSLPNLLFLGGSPGACSTGAGAWTGAGAGGA